MRRLSPSWRNRPRARAPAAGTALILVLWVMVVLSALALQLTFSSHLRLQATATLGQGAQALLLARAGVEKAIAVLVAKRDGLQPAADYYESETTPYSNVPLGEGAWTLFAGRDESSRPLYGIMDESAKINLLTADASVLSQVPGMTQQLASEIVMWRQSGEIRCMADLLRVEGIDLPLLYGNDADGDGLADLNEDNGDPSSPAGADARPDQGIAAHLTLWSAARNVSSEGKKRVNLNSAGADSLMKEIPGLKSEEANSIVAHRGKKAFAGIADLLDVELTQQPPPKSGDDRKEPPKSGDSGKEPPKATERRSPPPSDRPSSPPQGDRKAPEGETKAPASRVFDQNRLKEIADYVSLTDDETLKGLVNINTASARVLACLPGMTEATAAEIVRWRERRKDGFKTVADLLDVDGMTLDRFRTVCPLVSARSDVFSVRSFGTVQKGEVCRCVEAVIDRTGKSVRILQWRELD